MLDRVGLSDKADAFPSQLSGRPETACGHCPRPCMNPDIMLFSTSPPRLSTPKWWEVLQVMKKLAAEGMTMVVVTHEMVLPKDVGRQGAVYVRRIYCGGGNPRGGFHEPQNQRTKDF